MTIQTPGIGAGVRVAAFGDNAGQGEASLQAGLGAWASAISADDNAQAAIALAEAMNRARDARASRDDKLADGRVIAIGRLETLRAKLAPIYAAIPQDVELFDLGMVGHNPPRLFIDIIAFVEVAPDRRSFRLVQETRTGRNLLGETADERQMIALVTNYVAERLVERERALAALGSGALRQTLPKALAASIDLPVEAAPVAAASVVRSEQVSGAPIASPAPAAVFVEPAETPKTTAAIVLPRALTDVATAGPSVQAAAPVPAPAQPPRPAELAKGPVQGKSQPSAEQPAAMRRSSSGGWLWPILALMVGVGIGALALYLYALSLNRI